MTNLSEHYALDVPRGCRIVNPVEYGSQILAPGVIREVRMMSPLPSGAPCVEITFMDGYSVVVPTWLKITVDQDNPERRARVAWAKSILDLQ